MYVPGRPFSLQNCTVSNQSSDSLHVECVEGFDGGLPQGFLLELVEMPALRLARNLSLAVRSILFQDITICSKCMQFRIKWNKKKEIHWADDNRSLQFHLQRPPVSFFIDNLEPGSSYRIILFAVNPKGRSEPTIIDDINFKGVAKFTGMLILYVAVDICVFGFSGHVY